MVPALFFDASNELNSKTLVDLAVVVILKMEATSATAVFETIRHQKMFLALWLKKHTVIIFRKLFLAFLL